MKTTEQDERMGLPSASGMQRIAYCPGSWRAEQSCPEPDEASEDALMGTRLHAHMEADTIPDDPEEAEAINWCTDMIAALEAKYLMGGDGFNCADYEAEKEDIREIRMVDTQGQFSGKPDRVVIYCDKALIVDYKFGRALVSRADCNLQLATLAVLVRQHYLETGTVYAAILQPYASRSEPTVCKYDIEQLAAAERYIRQVIAAANTDGAPLRPQASACKYCRAQASCPAISRQLRTAAQGDLVAAWETWTPERRREAYDLAKLAKRWAAEVERKVETDLRAEVDIPGLVLGPGRKQFVVNDPSAAFAELNVLLPDAVTPEAYTSCCKVNVSDLDKLVHAARKDADPKATVKESKDWLRASLAACGEMKVTKGSIKEVEV